MRVDLPIWARLTICVVKALTYVYEFFTRPYYYITVNPMKVRRQLRSVRARPTIEGDPTSSYRCVECPDQLSITLFPGCATLDDMLSRAVKLWPQQDILGTRELLKEENELQPNGRTFIKQILGDYHWETYSQVDARIDAIGRGLLALGIPSRSNVLIFSETRAEWMIVAQTCFRYNMPLVTLYPTLGEEGIVHGIVEAEVSCIITSEDLLPKLVKLLPKIPNIRHIVYLNHGIFGGVSRVRTDSHRSVDAGDLDTGPNVQVHSITGLERVGKRKENYVDARSPAIKPKPDDLAVIMYTSGSTGLPKGVEITHKNLMAALSGQFPRIPVRPDDVYIGYLPLAHVLELACETGCIANGIRIGYSSPLTLFDNASKIKRGTLGDASVLQPTLMAAVPVILDRVYKAVWEKVIEGGPMSKALFKWAYQYKLNRLNRGYPSPMLDQLVFQKIRGLLGGRVRMMVSGGAPLSPESQNFINIVFGPIAQGYGLTETCGAATVMDIGDLHMHNVGAPLRCNEIRLREWVEGRYSPMDKPNPRGEVLIGGSNVARGYFKQPEKTNEDFFTDEAGCRWFCTGDIGRFNDDGTLSIIDRKKDLVKLQTGEYVSLGKVEMALNSCPFVETVCVYGEASKNYTVCLVVPKHKQLLKLAEGVFPDSAFSEKDVSKLCLDQKMMSTCLKQLQAAAAERRLERFEVPQAVHLLPDPWTPESGLVTAAFKLKRREIQNRFQAELDAMYNAKSRL